jgi:thioredoxin-related protein
MRTSEWAGRSGFAVAPGRLDRVHGAGRVLRDLLAALAILALVVALAGFAQRAQAAAALPAAKDLAADGGRVRADHLPVVLFFNRDGCPYCERALREYLSPMQRDAAYAGRALFRQVEVDKRKPLVDFAGKTTTHREFASRYKVTLTPTIWFVDEHGNALVQPIVGLPTLDFYQAYLDQAIADSQAKLAGGAAK